MSWNAHRAFNNTGKGGSYLNNLKVSPKTEERLTSGRDRIRDSLRVGFSDWNQLVKREVLFEGVPNDWRLPSLRPKFRMQGSFAYRTHVAPVWAPPQQTDLDDGLFLPVSFVTRNGTLEPLVASKGLFALVESILRPLCRQHGWEFDDNKSSCVRILMSDTEHIDIAIYAISDEAFLALLEKAALAKAGDTEATKRQLRESIDLDDLTYASLGGDQIALAHRKEGWKRSDPRKLDDWVKAALARHGEQFRRLSRYLKGWRDVTFEESRLASIALMAAVDTACRQALVEDSRDDLALLEIAYRLPTILSERIDNPVVDGERLDEGWSPEDRSAYVAAAKELADRIEKALHEAISRRDALTELLSLFGERFPADEDLIASEAALQTKAAALPAPAIASVSSADKRAKLETAFSESDQRRYGSKPWAWRRD